MPRSFGRIFSAILFLAAPTLSFATTWTVDPLGGGDALTIEAGIGLAAPGDTVLITAGTYVEHDLDLHRIVLKGATGDPDDVIIDADSLGRCISIVDVTSGPGIEALTLTHGYAPGTGEDAMGGGIFLKNSSDYHIENCVFLHNYAESEGGGLQTLSATDGLIRDCIFNENWANIGAGLHIGSSTTEIIQCEFRENIALESGGGLVVSGFDSSIDSCYFEGNFAASTGGAILARDYYGTLVNSAFIMNDAQRGGAILFEHSECGAQGCTFSENNAPSGGAIDIDTSVVDVVNTIIVNSYPGAGIVCDGESSVGIHCSDVWGNYDGDWVGCIASQDSINGNFHADPIFCGSGALPEDLYGLTSISPCANDTCGLIGAYPVACVPIVEWTGGGDGVNWEDASNWSPARVPTSDDSAYFPAPAIPLSTVDLNNDTTVYALTIDSSLAGYHVVLTLNDTLRVTDNGSNSGDIHVANDGALDLGSSVEFVNEFGGLVVLEGGHLIGEGTFINYGDVRRQNPAKAGGSRTTSHVTLYFDNRLDDPGDGAIHVADGDLAFEGEFANAGSVLVSGGTLTFADMSKGSRAESTITNSGTIVIEDGNILEIDGASTIFLNLDGGEVILEETGSVIGTGTFVNGGDLIKNDPTKSRAIASLAVLFDNRHDDPGDGAIHVNDGVLSIEGVFTNAGSTFVRAAAEALLDPGDGASHADAMTNSGVIIIESGADLTIRDSATVFTNLFGGTVILEGGNITGAGLFDNFGLISKTDPAKSRSLSSISTSLDNRHDDPGDGAIIVTEGTLILEGVFTNSGSLLVMAMAEALLDPGDGAIRADDMTNNGIIVVESSGLFGVNAVLTNTAGSDWLVDGTLFVDSLGDIANYGDMSIGSGGTVENTGDFDHMENAILSGNGTIDNSSGTFLCGGVIRPGASVGTFSFLGDFNQTATSEINVEFSGTDPGTGYDVLAISGSATLDGAIHVDLLEPFEPIEGDSFAIITITGVKGKMRGDIDCYSGLDIPGNLYLEPKQEAAVFSFVAIDSTSANNAPTAMDDADTTLYGNPITINVLANDTDVDLDPLTIVSVSLGSTRGDAVVDAGDTTLTFTPFASYVGLDSLVYLVTDCKGSVDSALVVVYTPRVPIAIYVPTDQPTIAAGISAAITQDTVKIEAGVYFEHSLTVKAGIILTGATGDPADVVIDAQGNGRVLYYNGSGSMTIVKDLTVRGGVQAYGGGMLSSGWPILISNCVFRGNHATVNGGGLMTEEDSSFIENCVFDSNTASQSGGGIIVRQSDPDIVNCLFTNNDADYGGGVYLRYSSASIESCTIAHNTVNNSGSGMRVFYGAAEIANTIFAYNTGDDAVSCAGGSPLSITCCDVYGNTHDYSDCISSMLGVNGNISEDPLFCGPDSGNYYLDLNSPCLDDPSCGTMGAFGSGCGVIVHTPGGGEPELPRCYSLSQNAPNPFNPLTTLRFTLPKPGHVTLIIYDISGRRVAELVDENLQAGTFDATWDGRNRAGRQVTSGIYFARMKADGFTAVRKMVLLR